MKRFLLALSPLILALAAGCASNGAKNDKAAPVATAPAAEAARAAPSQPVLIPAEFKKKIVLNMTGPKSSTESKDWSAFKEEWRSTFSDYAKDAGIAFEMQQGEVRTGAEPGVLLKVYVDDYRMIGIGARVFLGAMIGNAYIESKVTFADLRTGQTLGEQTYNTTSSMWHGVFAKTTPQQVDSIAEQVVGEIKKR